jgi:hypothetical protein
MNMPTRRLILGLVVVTALMWLVLALIGADALGSWGQAGLGVAGSFLLALFAPAYFGIDRDSHRRR